MSSVINFERQGEAYHSARHQLFTHVWGDKTNFKGLLSHPLIAPVVSLMWEDEDTKFNLDWIDPMVALEYVTQLVCITRLFYIEDDGEGFSGVEYWKNHILAMSALECEVLDKIYS